MRTIAIILLTFLLFAGCKKDKYGDLVHKMNYTTSKELKNKGLADELHYTQFGDYITSITPSSFIGEFDLIRIYGTTITSEKEPVFMTLIQPQSSEDNIRFADFSNNAEITLTPTLCGPIVNCNNDGTGGCFMDDAVFKLLHINLHNIRQGIELPVQYNGVNLSQYPSDSTQNGNIIVVDMDPLVRIINDTLQFYKQIMTFYFGMTDSTTVYTTEPAIHAPSSLNQDFDMLIPFVWSNKFNEWTLKSPANNETETIISTIGFDNENLIQIYAGADNIPYTSDDIIVYAPNFWERIYINVTTNID
ncbi:MAG: hypothetical protein ABIJ97_02920 [Bacteroidota bacterium]